MSAKKLCLYLLCGACALYGMAQVLYGLGYILMGLTFADPGPVLVRMGSSRALVGLACFVPALVSLVIARESK